MEQGRERRTALIVEDDPQIAQLMRVVLSGRGFEVSEVSDGALAGSAVRALHPDVVLLDIGLPGVHGLDVLGEIKSDPALTAIPVVVVSAWRTPDIEASAMGSGAAAMVGKPFSVGELADAVAAALAAPADAFEPDDETLAETAAAQPDHSAA